MWKNARSVLTGLTKNSSILTRENCLKEQIRTTYILKRKHNPQLHKKGNPPKSLRSRHYIYELVKDTSCEKQPDINVILTAFVDGLGNVGETVSVRSQYAYKNLLLPGLAVYASPENIDKYQSNIAKPENQIHYSSPNALIMMKILSRMTLSVVMNKDHPWTLQPWHIKTSFRKCGYVVPEDAITLPEIPIKGPDMNLESKEFFVTVTINKTEKVNIRCRLHHWSTNVVDRVAHEDKFWEKPSEPIHPEFQNILNEIPRKMCTN